MQHTPVRARGAACIISCVLPRRRYLTKENGYIRWQFGADNVLSVKGKETELLVLGARSK